MKTAMIKMANVTVNTMKKVGPVVKAGLKTSVVTVIIPTVVEMIMKKAISTLYENNVDNVNENVNEAKEDVETKVYKSASEWMRDHPGEDFNDKIYDMIYGGPSGGAVDIDLIYADYERWHGEA